MSSESSQKKKRKRESEKATEDANATKKRAVNGVVHAERTASFSSKKVKLAHVRKDEKWIPVIASAPGLSISPDISFRAYRKQKSDELLLYSSDHPRIDYTAREKQGGGIQDFLKHYIAIYDPKKKKVHVVEAKSMLMRGTLRAEAQEVRRGPEKKDNEGLSRGQQLALEFGTKKAKRTIDALSRNKIRTVQDPAALASPEAMKKAIEANPAAAALLESMAEGAANAPTADAIQAAADQGKPRPKYNPDAKTPSEVYPIGEVIDDDIWRLVKVKPWFDAIEDGKAVETPSRFVANRLKDIVEESADDAVQKVKILKWMLVLIKFYAACRGKRGERKLPKREELIAKLGEDSTLVDAVKKKFVPRDNEMTKWDVDYLMTHLAIYSLIVDDFDTDTYDLRLDLDMTVRIMRSYFREIGAKVHKMPDMERASKKLTIAEASVHIMAKLTKDPTFPKQRKVPVRR